MKNVGVAVVTGAGSGLGRHITLALAGAGWRVAAAGRRVDALEATAGLAQEFAGAAGGSVLPVATDVTDPESVAALFAAGSSTMAQSPRTRRARDRWGTPPPSTR
jgi:NAD(P)-dependent dehydrogenase (short-subunit alcohol dehydrogenase family)